jgi:hypothetical protein
VGCHGPSFIAFNQKATLDGQSRHPNVYDINGRRWRTTLSRSLSVALAQRQLVDHVNRVRRKPRLLKHQLRVFQELGECRATGDSAAEMREGRLAHEWQNVVRAAVLEQRPSQVLLVFLEAARERLAGPLFTVLALVSSKPRRHAYIRNVIGAITISGLVIHPC